MSEIKHTETYTLNYPAPNKLDNEDCFTIGTEPDGDGIVTNNIIKIPVTEDLAGSEQFAQYVHTAVNSHQKLVDALKELKNLYGNRTGYLGPYKTAWENVQTLLTEIESK